MSVRADSIELLERQAELDVLRNLLAGAAGGSGAVALVSGEAGIGRTALVRRFCDAQPESVRVRWGACEPLFTPRPLAPLVDIARATGGALATALQAGASPYEVAVALERDVVAQRPAIVVLEDMHLVDEATLDVVRLISRRSAELPLLLVLTYRDDVGRWHPLRMVLGELAGIAPVTRVRLACLSPDAVDTLASRRGAIVGGLYGRTAGNPFFVSELLDSGDEQLPETVRDAVLGRIARLSAGARRLLDVIAVARPRDDMDLLRAMAGDDVAFLDEAVAGGDVDLHAGFRHELAREAVEDSIPPLRCEALHRRAIELLAQPADGEPDAARLAHHAAAIGDGELVLRYAPLAGEQASAVGAHREAAAHFGAALRFVDLVEPSARAGLYGRSAVELFFIVEFEAAAAHQAAGIRCAREAGAARHEGVMLAFLGQLQWQAGHLDDALDSARRAVGLLDGPSSAELVIAYCWLSGLEVATEDLGAALVSAQRAHAMAEELDDDSSRIAALRSLGWVQYVAGAEGGLENLADSLERAKRAGDDFTASTVYTIVARTATRRHEYDIARVWVRDGLEYCSVEDHDVWRYYLTGWDARLQLSLGDWDAAAQATEVCLAHPCAFARIHALLAQGLLRARRGDPGAWVALDEALELAVPRHETQWIAQVAAARAEAAWLEGRLDAAIAETDAAYAGGVAGTWWEAGIAYWRRRAGDTSVAIPDHGEEQYRLELDGDWAGASEAWRAAGCHYEATFALLAADDEDRVRDALAEFQRLGASPVARLAAVRLRELGAGVPRGPYGAGRENPAQLTARELEVLALVGDGLRNAEIAERLVVSQRTVGHHISAILRKLGASNRAQAVTEAARLGIGTGSER